MAEGHWFVAEPSRVTFMAKDPAQYARRVRVKVNVLTLCALVTAGLIAKASDLPRWLSRNGFSDYYSLTDDGRALAKRVAEKRAEAVDNLE